MAIEKKRSTGLGKSCILIIVVASVERFAYKGVASNLVTFLTDVVKLSTSSAAKCVSTWSGVTSMLPLLSAVLVDSYWDRYSTITASSLLYIMGLVGLTSWAILYAWMPTFSLFLPLYLISIGQGGYNPSLQAFGADQLEIDDNLPCCKQDQEKKNKKSSFFQWWYFGICSGSLLGNSLMSYVQDTFGWGVGFAIPAISMSLSVGCFFSGTRFYVPKQNLRLPSREDDALELQEKPFRDDFDTLKMSGDNPSHNNLVSFTNVDEAPTPRVTAVILRLLPIWMMLLMFAVIFQQPATFFTRQGMVMKRNIGSGFVIPPAMLQSVITISIVLLMPLYDKLVRVITRDDKGISILQRIGVGMLVSIVAMVVAAVVESERLRSPNLSIFWLLPQYVLLGISDVFTVVGMQEFFYTQVPDTMRTIGISLYLSVFGVGSFFSALLISVFEEVTGGCGGEHSWFSDDMRKARLDNYYWVLALLSSFSFLMFAYLCRYYRDYDASPDDGKN